MSESWPQRLLSLVGSPAGIAASYVESLLPAAAERGLDVRELLRVVDIPAEQLALPGYRLPLFKAFALLLQAERLGGSACAWAWPCARVRSRCSVIRP